MKFLIIIIFILFYTSKTFAFPTIKNQTEDKFGVKCELITYNLIYFHFIKCSFTKKINGNGELKELYFNSESSFIFFDYQKTEDDYYFPYT